MKTASRRNSLNQVDPTYDNDQTIKIIGIGGGGKNSLNRLYEIWGDKLNYIYINTSQDSLNTAKAECEGTTRVLIGDKHKGLISMGSNGRKGLAKKAANEDRWCLEDVSKGAETIIISSTLGGGTGSGISPVMAKVAREQGANVIAFVTRPFRFEGHKKRRKAREAVKDLKKYVDILFDFDNEKLLKSPGEMPMADAFSYIDNKISSFLKVLFNTFEHDHDSVDFEKRLLNPDGFYKAQILNGEGSGENFVEENMASLFEDIIQKPDLRNVTQFFVNFRYGREIQLAQVSILLENINKKLGNPSCVNFAYKKLPELKDKLEATLILLKPSARN